MTVRWRVRETALADLQRAAEAASPGQWIYTMFTTDVNADMRRPETLLDFTRHDLDSVVPDNPIMVITGLVARTAIVNTKLLEIITGIYGEDIGGYERDDQGVLTGRLTGTIGGVVNAELFPLVPPELSAPLYKREMEEWVAIGVTTVSTRLAGNYITTYAYMDRHGQLPMRLAYSRGREVESVYGEVPEAFRRPTGTWDGPNVDDRHLHLRSRRGSTRGSPRQGWKQLYHLVEAQKDRTGCLWSGRGMQMGRTG